MAIRFGSMEHYRSVFATSAAIVFGLVAASHIAYPRGPEEERVRAGVSAPAQTHEAGTSAWSDPPSAMLGVAALEAPLDAASSAAGSVAKPASFTRLESETAALFTAVPLAEVPMATGRPAASVPTKHRRTVRHAGPVRTAAATSAPQAAPASPAQGTGQTAEPSEKRVDLIGSLLKGLGIGREG